MARADGLNEPIAPWDWRYYAEKVRQSKYALDEASVKPYFVARQHRPGGVRHGRAAVRPCALSSAATAQSITRMCATYEVRDAADRPIGLFLHDNFARPGKHSGAWMSSYREQQSLDGEVLPIVVNNNNFSKGDPTLLSFDDARTLFHEFGHGLHGLLSRVRYPSQSGTAVRRDFVEFPSQVFEHWFEVPDTLRRYARHYQRTSPCPRRSCSGCSPPAPSTRVRDRRVRRLRDARSRPARRAERSVLDIDAFEREFAAKVGLPPEIGLRHRPAHFGHLFAGGGYAAGYYAYLWAEVLDADGFAAFAERGDPFAPDLAERLAAIYSAGDTADPMELYRAFRGRDPEVAPLLKKRGLAA